MTDDDYDLLDLAAKAAGFTEEQLIMSATEWNPLTDDGDALRLAVRMWGRSFLFADLDKRVIETGYADEEIAESTRRAIVRAAAEIGKGMK